jgi:hypothetical protein
MPAAPTWAEHISRVVDATNHHRFVTEQFSPVASAGEFRAPRRPARDVRAAAITTKESAALSSTDDSLNPS